MLSRCDGSVRSSVYAVNPVAAVSKTATAGARESTRRRRRVLLASSLPRCLARRCTCGEPRRPEAVEPRQQALVVETHLLPLPPGLEEHDRRQVLGPGPVGGAPKAVVVDRSAVSLEEHTERGWIGLPQELAVSPHHPVYVRRRGRVP